MHELSHWSSPEVTVALALALGMVAQSVARHLRLPGIVLLLVTGMLLGPDLAGLVDPQVLGAGLHILVGFAVAVILFEGGLTLNLKRIRSQARVIRRLLTVGALVTALGGAGAALGLMGWGWRPAILFGTLVIVTGPTVITPLLRRIKVKHNVSTVLEAEGVLIDAVGVVVAVVALEVTLAFSGDGFVNGVLQVVARLGFGLVMGLFAGFALAALFRVDNLVPEGLQNVFTLAAILAVFQLSNAFLPESGVMTVIAAGMVVGNLRNPAKRDLREFKEQLTVLLIGMLFVLLAAGVRLEEIRSLGWAGVATVAALMFAVRPVNVLISTAGSDLTWRERAFLGWLAPRGVVAAAVASLFAQTIASETAGGDPTGQWAGGEQLQALVFLVIATTVLVQGLTGGIVARLLGLQRPGNRGYAILGANELGHTLGRLLRDAGEEVMFLDGNPAACHIVEQDGFRVVFGNVLLTRTLFRARVEDRAACIAVTPNEEANLLFSHQAVSEFKVPRLYVALSRTSGARKEEDLVRNTREHVLFAAPRDLELWALRLRRDSAAIEGWIWNGPVASGEGAPPFDSPPGTLLPLVCWRGKRTFPVNTVDGLRVDDRVHFAVSCEVREEAHRWLRERGWSPLEPTPGSDDSEDTDVPDRKPVPAGVAVS